MVGEVVQVGDGGAAPAVDGLAGVADGGHRMARAAAEQAGEHDSLRHGGVLVLVQEDDLELLPEQRAHLGAGGREGRGQGDLVAEVQQLAPPLLGAVRPDQLQQLQAAADRLGHLAQVGVGQFHLVEGGEQLGVVRPQPVRLDQVLGQLAVEREQVLHEGGQRLRQGGVRAGGGAQHPGGELEAGGVGEQAGAGLQADAQAVVLEELAGEGVVRGDPGLAGHAVRGGRAARPRATGPRTGRAERIGRFRHPGRRQGLADALRQLARRLVRERQPEHLLGGDLARADQPHHARGHDRGLAGTGAGHDDLRGGRCGDAGRLLRGERDAEELLELLGVGDAS